MTASSEPHTLSNGGLVEAKIPFEIPIHDKAWIGYLNTYPSYEAEFKMDLRTIGRVLCRALIAFMIIVTAMIIALIATGPFFPKTGRGGGLNSAPHELTMTIIWSIIWGLLISGFAVLAYARLNWNWLDALCTMLLTGAITAFLICGFSGLSFSEISRDGFWKFLIPVESSWLAGVFIGIAIKSRKSSK